VGIPQKKSDAPKTGEVNKLKWKIAAILQFFFSVIKFVLPQLYYHKASLNYVSSQKLIPIKNWGGKRMSKIITEKCRWPTSNWFKPGALNDNPVTFFLQYT